MPVRRGECETSLLVSPGTHQLSTLQASQDGPELSECRQEAQLSREDLRFVVTAVAPPLQSSLGGGEGHRKTSEDRSTRFPLLKMGRRVLFKTLLEGTLGLTQFCSFRQQSKHNPNTISWKKHSAIRHASTYNTNKHPFSITLLRIPTAFHRWYL